MTVTPADTDMPLAVARDLSARADRASPGTIDVSWGEGSRREHLVVNSPELAACLLALPSELSSRQAVDRLRERVGLPERWAQELVGQFVELGMLSDEVQSVSPGEDFWLDVEWDDALRFHRASRGMIWSHDYSGDPKVMTRYHVDHNVVPSTGPPVPWMPPISDRIRLPEPEVPASLRYDEVARARRTSRAFTGTSVTLGELGTILGLTFGARFPIDQPRYPATQTYSRGRPFSAYLIVNGSGAPPELASSFAVYHYDPDLHSLGLVRDAAELAEFDDLLWGQTYGNGAPAMLVVCADWPQFSWKYRFPRGYRFVYVECGAFMQTALVVATSLGLRSFATPAIDDSRMCRTLDVDDALVGPIYMATLGKPEA